MEETNALIKTLEIYAATDRHVTQHFYQGLCISASKRLTDLQAENATLKELLRQSLPIIYNTYRSDDLGPKSLPCRIEQALKGEAE